MRNLSALSVVFGQSGLTTQAQLDASFNDCGYDVTIYTDQDWVLTRLTSMMLLSALDPAERAIIAAAHGIDASMSLDPHCVSGIDVLAPRRWGHPQPLIVDENGIRCARVDARRDSESSLQQALWSAIDEKGTT